MTKFRNLIDLVMQFAQVIVRRMEFVMVMEHVLARKDGLELHVKLQIALEILIAMDMALV